MTNKTKAKTAEEQIAAFAHEVRNPLALIRANLQYVELTDKKRKSKKNYEIIYREIDRINDILNNCIASSTAESLDLKHFKINTLLDELNQIFEQALSVSQIRLIVRAADVIDISADYNKLKQVLINIVQNAKESIEATGNKENGLIEICAFKKEGFLNIRISDNGVGISDADLKMIGTPFFTKKEKGCGLGISISKEIIEMHKGVMSISGSESQGASVLIILPLA